MNCIIVDNDEITGHLLETLVSEIDFLHLIKNCSTPSEASDVLLKEKIDLIFLDVMMSDMSGVEFLKILDGNKPEIIMISSNKNLAVDAYDFGLCDFIQ